MGSRVSVLSGQVVGVDHGLQSRQVDRNSAREDFETGSSVTAVCFAPPHLE